MKMKYLLGLVAGMSACVLFVSCREGASPDVGALQNSSQAVTTTYPNIGFTDQPANDNKAIALTFDDGPDPSGNTDNMVSVLKAQGVPATFFINTNNWENVNTSPAAQNTIRNIVANGFTLGNHTVDHTDLTTLSNAQVEAEISGVENTVRNIFGASAPSLTLFRAPYGDPYYDAGDQAHLDRIAPIVARHAVHIGWAIDSLDWNCTSGAACTTQIHDNVISAVDAGHWGIVLLHAVYATTVNAMPSIIADLRSRGFHFVTVEDVVRAKYGQSSAQLVAGVNGTTGGTTTGGTTTGGTTTGGTTSGGTTTGGGSCTCPYASYCGPDSCGVQGAASACKCGAGAGCGAAPYYQCMSCSTCPTCAGCSTTGGTTTGGTTTGGTTTGGTTTGGTTGGSCRCPYAAYCGADSCGIQGPGSACQCGAGKACGPAPWYQCH